MAEDASTNPSASDAEIQEHLDHPLSKEGLPDSGLEAVESHGESHAAPNVLGMDATGWVALSMLVVIALVLWKKVPAAIGASLDKKIAEIKAQLDEARKLREEAEELKSKYESRLKAADAEAEEIRQQAEKEAEALLVDAKRNTTDLIARRRQMAEDKIAAAERQALADVQAKAANAATAAAASLIAEKHDAGADKALVDKAISGLGRVN